MRIIGKIEAKMSHIVTNIREISKNGYIVNFQEVVNLVLADDDSTNQLDNTQEYELPPKEILSKMKSLENCSDIKLLKGAKNHYFFSEMYMTKEYATMIIKMEEGDNPSMMADIIRKDCQKYPRPTDIKVFSKFPFFMNKQEIEDVYEKMEKHPDFRDIKYVQTSKGKKYFYSQDYMSEQYANKLAELLEHKSDFD